MKRRTFLSTTGAIGVIGTLSSATVATSAYTSISTSVSLAEFPSNIKIVLDNFTATIAKNVKELGLAEELTNNIVMPIRIVGKDFKKGIHSIAYKNKAGQYVSLAVKNGVETVRISNTL